MSLNDDLDEHAYQGDLESMKEDVANGADVNHENEGSECTAAHYAALSNRLDIIQFLLQSGAHMKQEDDEGLTPLERAAYEGHVDIVRELMDHEVDFSRVSNETGVHSIEYAANHPTVLNLFFSRGVKVDESTLRDMLSSNEYSKESIDMIRDHLTNTK